MTLANLLRLAKEVLTLPTAPYHEHAVREFVATYSRSLGWRPRCDSTGNLIVRPPHPMRGTPLVLVAHMDHPGFEAIGANRARFLGRIPKEMFRAGCRLRFHTASGTVTARIQRALHGKGLVALSTKRPLQRGDFGGWDLPTFRYQRGLIHAARIDDVLGVVALLAVLAELTHRRLRQKIWAVFTRAEEIGFVGALEIARSGMIPSDALVVSLETSQQRPWARGGDGPVIRLGDRMIVFDPDAAWFLAETARRARIPAQRCLMDGGTCEATAFAAYGYRVAGLCVPLGNYHNIGTNHRPAVEYASGSDLLGLVKLSLALARRWPGFRAARRSLRNCVEKIRRSAPPPMTSA